MLKRRGLWLIVIAILSLSFGVVAAQDEAPVISDALQAQMDQIEAITREVRQLDSTFPIVRDFPTRAELREYVNGMLNEEMSPEMAADALIFYTAFDLIPPDTDLRAVYEELLGAQIAGFYDNETRIMNVIPLSSDTLGELLSPAEQLIYSHEYAHALQDMNFGIEALGLVTEQGITEPDRFMAALALVEGDAYQVMAQYMMAVAEDNPMAVLGLIGSLMESGGGEMPPGTPPILITELLSSYLDGGEFVMALYQQGGWAAVDAAYADLPVSTEQILHPDRYLAGDDPIVVMLDADEAAYVDALGEGWSLVWDRTLGEFYLRQYLYTQIGGRAARLAAQGWGGDRYLIFHNEDTGQLAWVLRFEWDTPEDAAQFTEVYGEFGDDRFDTERDGDCWSNDAEALCMVTEGESGHLLAFAPSVEAAEALIAGQS